MEQWLLNNLGSDASQLGFWPRMAILASVIIVAFLTDIILNFTILPIIRKITKRTETQWDDILFSDRVCKSFSAILPPVVLSTALPYVLKGILEIVVVKLVLIYLIFNVCRFVTILMRAIYDIFIYEEHVKARSLRGILQTLQIVVWIIGIILIISTLIDRSPVYLITGLGAAATVLMLVFQDSIKGLVAGIQLTLNDMVRVGDWICMPSRGVDGVVTEITLSTVKVQNWDNTIMTILPYSLLTDTFQNWRGMTESGGRRLTRSLNVSMHSVKLLTAQDVARYRQKGLLPAVTDEATPIEPTTNLEAYRISLCEHVRQMPEINESMTLMVRQLQATSEGIPVQLYAFTHTKEWGEYEEIQSRLVEYMLALMPEFDILPYQRSSDMKAN